MKQFAPRYAALGVIIVVGAGVMFYEAAQRQLRAVQTKNCQINLKIIGLAMLQYNRDYDEKYPLAERWADSLKPYAVGTSKPNREEAFAKMFHCPTTGSFYSYNRNLETVTMEQVVPFERETLVIEVVTGQTKPNLSGGGELWPSSPIHETAGTRGNHVLFADGHVELTTSKPAFRSFMTPTSRPTEIKPARTAKP